MFVDLTHHSWTDEDIAQIFSSDNAYAEKRQRLARAGIRNLQQCKLAIAALEALQPETPVDPIEVQIKHLEQSLIGSSIPGWFPTPPFVLNLMIGKANVKPGMHSLEPSAGDGRLASSMRAAGLEPDVIEIQSCLRDILKLKGFNLVGHDFIEYDLGGYDIICQNPPFEKGQDLAHVQKAYTLLKPGGRLVSVVSNSIEFRQQKKYSLFRDWLKQVKAENIELPDGAFLESPERPCAVKTRLLVIDQPM